MEYLENKKKSVELLSESYNELSQDSKAITWIKQIFSCVTVEPIIICYQFVSLIAAESIRHFYLQSACHATNTTYDEIFCEAFLRNNTYNTENDIIFQEMEDLVKDWRDLTSFLPSIMLFVVGCWSDKKGRRKICVLLPLIIEFFGCAGLLMSYFFLDNLPIELTAIFEAIFNSLRNGSLIMSVYSYIGANTSEEERTLRIGTASFIFQLSTLLGELFKKEFDESFGHWRILWLAILFYLSGLTYGYYRLEENYVELEDISAERRKMNCCTKAIKNKIDKIIILQRRENYGRVILILLLLAFIFAEFPGVDDNTTLKNYTNAKFGWTLDDSQNFRLLTALMHLIGLFIVLVLFIRYCELPDTLIGIIGCCASITTSTWYIFAQNESSFIWGSVVGALRTTKAFVIRSMASKIFPDFQQGKVQMIFEVLNDFLDQSLPLLSALLYVISDNTVETYSRKIFSINTGMLIIAIMLLQVIYILQKKIAAKIKKENTVVLTTLNGAFQFTKD